MAARNPVTYAEQNLKVHELYDEHKLNIRLLEEAAARKAALEVAVRDTEFTLKEHEMGISEKMRVDPEFAALSIAAFERGFKSWCHGDEEHHRLRTRLLTAQNDLSHAEVAYTGALATERATRARIQQIGSLLRFYAAGKEATTAAKLLIADPANNWP